MTTERQRQQAAERKRERAEIQCESAEEDCDTAEGQRMVSEETRHFIEGVEHLREGASQDTLQRMTELMDRLEQRMSRVEARMVQATKEIREAVQAFRATMVHAQHHTMIDACDYWRTCFVIMPYKVRKFRGQSIDFDRIYYTIFTPAIQNVEVYDTKLKPHRADEPAQSRLLIHKMIQDLACSRLALADLTTYNPNVHYEVGLRHALVPSGTVLVSQPGIPIPFDLGQVLVTKYNDGPPEEVEISVRKISKALCETLEHNEVDNPVYAAGRAFARRMGTAEQPTHSV